MRAILTFHSIDDSGSVLSYPVSSFARLLAALDRIGMPVVDLDTLLLPGTGRGVALTFDDGIRSVHSTALPILRDYAAPAHLFLTTGCLGATNRWPSQPASAPLFEMLTWSEVQALHRDGFRIEAHTVNHPDLRTLTNDELAAELEGADAEIVAHVGVPPRYFAHPYGWLDARTVRQVRQRYRGAVTARMDWLSHAVVDPAMLPRIEMFYLQREWFFRDIEAPATRWYLTLRSLIRQLRGMG